MNNLLKKLNIENNATKRVNKESSFNHVKDNIPLVEDYNMMADLLIYCSYLLQSLVLDTSSYLSI